MNRHRKIEKQMRLKQLRSLQKPISRTKKELDHLRAAVKAKTITLAVLLFIMLTALLRSLEGFYRFDWHQQTIRFDSIKYISYYIRGTPVKYYLLTDEAGEQYHIRQFREFNNEAFEENVRKGDVLKITWSKHLWSKDIEAMHDAKDVYLSYDYSVQKEERYAALLLILPTVLLLPTILLGRSLSKSIRRRKLCFAQLKSAQEDLEQFQESPK